MAQVDSAIDIVRLLLSDHHRCRRHPAWNDDAVWAVPYRDLAVCLSSLRRERPDAWRALRRAWLDRPGRGWWYSSWDEYGYEQRALLIDFAPPTQRQIDEVLQWIVDRMSTPVVLPPWHSGEREQFEDERELDNLLADKDGEWHVEPAEEWRTHLGALEPEELPIDFAEQDEPPTSEVVPSDALVASSAYEETTPSVPLDRRPARRRTPLSAVSASRVADLLLAEMAGSNLDDLRGLLRRGRPSDCEVELRRSLAIAIHHLRTERRVRVGALAEVLQCDPATVWRQTRRGEAADLSR